MIKLDHAHKERTTLARELDDARAMNASEMSVLKDIHAQEKAQWVARVEGLENDLARVRWEASVYAFWVSECEVHICDEPHAWSV